MKTLVELENMEFRASHGCFELEKVVGNRFTVDMAVEAETGSAAADDDLGRCVNYQTLYDTVREQMAVPSDTIENVAWRIAEAVRAAFPGVERVTVRVSKLAPPLGGKVEKASVTVEG